MFFCRYQRKIGTYDKQQWERTVEQHILDGLTHVPMRTAKLKTELIDVDLVRGELYKCNLRISLCYLVAIFLLSHVYSSDICRCTQDPRFRKPNRSTACRRWLAWPSNDSCFFPCTKTGGFSKRAIASLCFSFYCTAYKLPTSFCITLTRAGKTMSRYEIRSCTAACTLTHDSGLSLLCLLADCIHVGGIGTHRHDVYSLHRSFAHRVDAFGSCHDVQSIQTTNNQAFSTRQVQKRKIKAPARFT